MVTLSFKGGGVFADRCCDLWQVVSRHRKPAAAGWDRGQRRLPLVRGCHGASGHAQAPPNPPLRLHDRPLRHLHHPVLRLVRCHRSQR